MSDGISTGLGTAIDSRPLERNEDEKTTRDQAERWATLLGAQLKSVVPRVSVSEPTSGWRAGAGDLTLPSASGMPAGAASAGGIGDAGEATADVENRLIVRVDGGDLGEVALCVDRKEGAISVTIRAADAAAEAALGLERASLLQALESHGITVDSVKVVRGGDFGTLPAQRSSATRRARDAAEAESTDDNRERRRLSRKLNLIG